MNSYIQNLSSEMKWRRDESERLITKFDTDATVDSNGVVRWNSNNSVPPTDILELWQYVGKNFNFELSMKVRDEEITASLNEYRKRMANYEMSNEERAELIAVHGKGARIVNVITGKVTIL